MKSWEKGKSNYQKEIIGLYVIIKSTSTKSSPMLRTDKNGTVIGGEVGGIPNSWIYDNPMNNLYTIYVKKADLERAKDICKSI
jgi:hypothetical protein